MGRVNIHNQSYRRLAQRLPEKVSGHSEGRAGSNRNFVFTRDLKLHLNIASIPVTYLNRCTAIKSTIDQVVSVFEYAWPYLKTLDLKINPFIPTDCASNEWTALNSCNDSIYHLLGQIADSVTDIPVCIANIGRLAWAFDAAYRPHPQQILWLLAPRITSLKIAELSYFLNPWLPVLHRLQHLSIQSLGSVNNDNATAMWNAISALRLSSLHLMGSNFRRKALSCKYVGHRLLQSSDLLQTASRRIDVR